MSQRRENPGDDVALIKLLYETAEAMVGIGTDALAELALTQSQVSLIWALGPESPPMAMREVARKLRFDPSNITLITDQLVAAGIVERQTHPTDGRQRVLVLTPQGLAVWRALIDRVRERSPIFALPESERAELTRLLARARDASSQDT